MNSGLNPSIICFCSGLYLIGSRCWAQGSKEPQIGLLASNLFLVWILEVPACLCPVPNTLYLIILFYASEDGIRCAALESRR